MSPSNVLTRVWILALALMLLVPATVLAQDDDEREGDEDDERGQGQGQGQGQGRPDDRPPQRPPRDDDDDEDDEEDDDGGRGRGEERRRERDEDDRSRAAREGVRGQVGQFQLADSGASGSFVSFRLADGGIADYAYRNQTIFTHIGFDPALDADEIEMQGARFQVEGDDAEFDAVDTPSAQFKAEVDDGTVDLVLAPGFSAAFTDDPRGDDHERLRITNGDYTAYLTGEEITLSNRTITSQDEVHFNIHAPALRGHLASQIGTAAEEGRLAGEVIVTNDTEGEDTLAVPHGPFNLSAERAANTVTVTIEGHGNGSALLFDLERGAIGGVDDMVILFDGERIHAADDLDDVLDAQADEAPEYLIIVGGNKTQVLVSIPHFSVHTIQLSSAGPVSIIQPLLGSPVAALAAAAVAGLFVAVSWGIRNRQR